MCGCRKSASKELVIYGEKWLRALGGALVPRNMSTRTVPDRDEQVSPELAEEVLSPTTLSTLSMCFPALTFVRISRRQSRSTARDQKGTCCGAGQWLGFPSKRQALQF